MKDNNSNKENLIEVTRRERLKKAILSVANKLNKCKNRKLSRNS